MGAQLSFHNISIILAFDLLVIGYAQNLDHVQDHAHVHAPGHDHAQSHQCSSPTEVLVEVQRLQVFSKYSKKVLSFFFFFFPKIPEEPKFKGPLLDLKREVPSMKEINTDGPPFKGHLRKCKKCPLNGAHRNKSY